MKKVKVAFITDKTGLGGGETSLINLLEVMQEGEVEAILICPPGLLTETAISYNIPVRNIYLNNVHLYMRYIPYLSIKSFISLFIILFKENVNIIHVESELSLYYAGIIGAILRIPCFATYHGYWKINSKISQIALNILLKKIFSVSKNTEEEINKYLKKNIIKTINLGINRQYFEELESKEELRKKLNLPLEKKIIIQVARYQTIKGQHILIKAIERIIARYSNEKYLFVLLGDTMNMNEEETKYKSKIMTEISNRKLNKYIQVINHRMNVHEYLKAADCLVVPSIYETFGMVIIEAMHVGCPVVATDAGGPAEIIKNKINGILVNVNDIEKVSEGILFILDNESQARRISNVAKEMVSDKYHPKRRLKELLREYHDPSNK